jgi:DNA-binding response OmpR family regulator
MSGARILVAEDDRNIRNGLVDALESEGYEAVPAANGPEALTLFAQGHFDLILLDVMMPGKSGYDVCREIRARNADVPIIMLTAKGEEIDKVVGLQLGADDYVTKPFGVHELLARIAAVLRRAKRGGAHAGQPATNLPDRFAFGPGEVDAREYKFRVAGKTFDLTARELHLLRLFKSRPNEVLGRDALLNEVWGIAYYGTTRTLDQHIAQLRKKIEPRRGKVPCISTVHGVGYRYDGG